jgi:hypothetical protein
VWSLTCSGLSPVTSAAASRSPVWNSACPDFAAAGAYLGDAIERFHGRVGEVGQLVDCFDFLGGAAHRGRHVAFLLGLGPASLASCAYCSRCWLSSQPGAFLPRCQTRAPAGQWLSATTAMRGPSPQHAAHPARLCSPGIEAFTLPKTGGRAITAVSPRRDVRPRPGLIAFSGVRR